MDIEELAKEKAIYERNIEARPDDSQSAADLVRVVGIIGQHRKRLQQLDSSDGIDVSFQVKAIVTTLTLHPGRFITLPPALFSSNSTLSSQSICWCLAPTRPEGAQTVIEETQRSRDAFS